MDPQLSPGPTSDGPRLYACGCPSLAEVEFLRKRDIMGDIKFTDLNDLNYRPGQPVSPELSLQWSVIRQLQGSWARWRGRALY